VTRPADDERAGYALRIAYLIDPEGTIRRAYEVTDTAGFAELVLGDLAKLSAS
jgi:peroxiredoxin